MAAIAGQRGQGCKAILAACYGVALRQSSQRAQVRPNTALLRVGGHLSVGFVGRADLVGRF